MPWLKLPANSGMGLEAQDLLRWKGIPVASVKRQESNWECSCLNLTGISCVRMELPLTMSLEQVRDAVETMLESMGWEPESKQQRNIQS